MTVLAVVTACVLAVSHHSQAHYLSLVFERYSTRMDFFVEDVAFLWLTNSSDRTYCLPMTGGTNTFLWDTAPGFGRYKQQRNGSHEVSCEFSDKPARFVNPMQWGQCLSLAPHSAVRLRVALPPNGQKRRVAVLCAEKPSGSPRPFWTNGIGLSILRMLPRSVGMKLLFSQPAVQRVWCDRELSYPGERLAE